MPCRLVNHHVTTVTRNNRPRRSKKKLLALVNRSCRSKAPSRAVVNKRGSIKRRALSDGAKRRLFSGRRVFQPPELKARGAGWRARSCGAK